MVIVDGQRIDSCLPPSKPCGQTHYQSRPLPGFLLRDRANRHVIACAGPYFALERWMLTRPHIEPDRPWRCLTLSSVGTPVQVEYQDGSETLTTGESYIIPVVLK